MSGRYYCRDRVWHSRVLASGLALGVLLTRLSADQEVADEAGVAVLSIKGPVEVLRVGATAWTRAWAEPNEPMDLDAGDQVRTGENGRALLRLADGTTTAVGGQSQVRVLPPRQARSRLFLFGGLFYFFHRARPGDLELETGTLTAAVRGTEFNVAVAEDGASSVSLLDGSMELQSTADPGDRLMLTGKECGVARVGQPLRRTAIIETINVIQWCLYYPAVLDPEELALPPEARSVLAESLAAYREGGLMDALAKFPAGRRAASDAERVYHAALLLSAGQVQKAEAELDQVGAAGTPGDNSARLAEALRTLISAVKGSPRAPAAGTGTPLVLATEWLAESYHLQAQTKLPAACEAARRAVQISPGFAFGWARVAELEFSLGHVAKMRVSTTRSVELAPRNAQALALRGFVASAANQVDEAMAWFNRAMAADPALGNAWLGRGLCRLRRGNRSGGLEDLQAAATLEPQRGFLRSYLGKAFSDAGRSSLATKELALAKGLDPGDPTAWLYSALLGRQDNRMNEGVRDLERSIELNDNRQIYRSRFLLDQDRAVRAANLARLYADAGLEEVSLHEASRAVNADYANYSAHRFLADSYQTLRDPAQVNLRYETPWLAEYLVANLLAPVGAGALSPAVTQQEYSRLFEREGLGLSSATTYYSRGDWQQNAVQHGIFGNTAYAAEVTYLSENGDRPNDDLDQRTITLRFKQQLTLQDSVYLQGIYYEAEGGDLAPYYDPTWANRGLRFRETQEPILLLGYHREWQPGVHTLLLAGRLEDTLSFSNPQQQTLAMLPPPSTSALPVLLEQDYRSKLKIYTAELQQIWQGERHLIIGGGRFQTGEINTWNQHLSLAGQFSPVLGSAFASLLPADTTVDSSFERTSLYGYAHWQVIASLRLIAGLSYDRLTLPRNYQYAPLAEGEETTDGLSPKAGLIWTPAEGTTVRAAYSRSRSGASIDQSFQLEPSQVAGFTQSYRSVVPEAVVGTAGGAVFEVGGLSLEQKLPSRTYVAVTAQWLQSDLHRAVGAFALEFTPWATVSPQQIHEDLEYEERSLVLSVNQLLGDQWSVGLRYELSRVLLDQRFREVAASAGLGQGGTEEALLHSLDLYAVWNHPSGFFGRFDALWYSQSNRGYVPDLPGDDFWQFNVLVGYRFFRRQAELVIGGLNLTGQDYRLNPLQFTPQLFRDRTLMVSLRFSF